MMKTMHKTVLLGLLIASVSSCESPTLFRNQSTTLSPLGPLGTSPALAPRGDTLAPPTAPSGARTLAEGRTTRPTRSNRQPKVMIFDVRDLLMATPNFVAPEMDIFGSGGEREFPEPLEAQAFIDEDTLLDALRAALPEDALSENSTMRIVGGRLFVTNPPK